ncbi:hypothetical protein TIFTF001_031057 [Ficus carica]|uniref:Uncharacterized protein n=1 Tax=Ficus carica TaxID=3494 RepID=A0AA88J3Q2_FICCA|nr:hypothetical protein TIFTF001_031057 [Ficus carica]
MSAAMIVIQGPQPHTAMAQPSSIAAAPIASLGGRGCEREGRRE